MFERPKQPIIFVLFLCCLASVIAHAQDEAVDEKIIIRYKQMLERKPKEGSTFDRLYQLYLEGQGLDQMVIDYRTEAAEKPENPNLQLILGHIYKRLGKSTEAILAYQRAVDLASDDYYPHFALGQMYATLRQHEQAIAALTKATDLAIASQAATPDELTATYKALGRAYFRRDRIDEAIAAWGKIAELDPENIFSRIELADLFREGELYTQAIEQHEAVVQLKRDDPYRVCLSLREIGKIQEEMREYDSAVQNYDKALALTGQGNWLRKDLHQRIIGIYAHNGDWPGLITYYEGKLAQTPNDVELIGLLANAYIENEGIDEGIAKYQQGLELAPTDAILRLNLIAVFRNTERFEEAAAEYEILSEAQPDDFGIYRELGELYLQLEDKDRAKTTYQRMIDRDPDNAGTHLTLAEIYIGHEWMDDAIAAYEKAISLAPENLDYIEYFGEFYYRQGNREKAVETWGRMVTGEGAIAENYDRLAQLLDTKYFREEAVVASRKAVELVPNEYRYREALAQRLMEGKDYEEALAEYTEAAKLAPNPFFAERMTDQQIEIYRRQGILAEKIDELEASPESFEQQKQLAKMFLKLGNVTNALEILIKAKGFKTDDVQVNRWLVELYTKSGRRDDAVAIYNYLIEIDAGNAREYYSDIARLHLRAMDFDVATAAAKQAIAHSPRNPEGYQLLAGIDKQRGHYEGAVDSLKQAVRLRPESTEIRAELADVYQQGGDYRQAIEQYWRCWDLSDELSEKLSFINRLEGAYYDFGRSDELEEKFQQMARVNPNDQGPVLGLAELYRGQGDLPAAREQLARALEQETQNPDLLTQLVKINLELGENQEALSYQQRLVKAQPNPYHQQKLGEMLFDIGREQEAIQTWSKLLHARNKDVEAEIKLAGLLSQHGLVDEALSALDRAGEQVMDAKKLYHIGALLVEMNELERAASHFERILAMPEPVAGAKKNVGQPAPINRGQKSFLPDTRRFNLLRDLVHQIQRPYRGSAGARWLPTSFEDTQAGALTQLGLIAQRERRFDDFIAGFEAKAEAHPQDLQILETLVKVNILMQKPDKTLQTVDRLIALSSNDLSYKALQLNHALQHDLDYDTAKGYLDGLSQLSLEARLWYTSQLANALYRGGKQTDAKKLVHAIEDTSVTEVQVLSEVVRILTQIGETGTAEQILAEFPVASGITRMASTTRQGSRSHRTMYANLSYAYVRDGQIDKAIAIFWKFFEDTKSTVANARAISIAYSSHSYGGYNPLQTNFPTSSIYYNQDRLQFLQEFFHYLWTWNQLEPLYAEFQAEFEGTEGEDKIYPGLALSYFYWWEGKRNKAEEILAELQAEFPDNLTLTLQTGFVSLHTGKHQGAMEAFTKLADKDRRNRQQYNDLILQVAIYTGDTVTVRELLSKVLSSPVSARALKEFAEKLQQSGLTQYAIVASKGAMKLAMGQRDPNFLIQLSQQLEELGRGQDAAIVAERALRFANRRDQYGQTMHNWYFQRASNMARRRATKEREDRLILAAEKNPNSFRVQINLATYYEAINQTDKAAKAFDAALALRPKDGLTRQRYAQMLMRGGRTDAATTQYTILLRDDPNALGYNYWDMMRTFFDVGKAKEIAALAKETIRPSIGRGFGSDFAESVARECIRSNYPEGAVAIYEKLLAVNPTNARTYDQLASAYTASGNRDKAIQFLRTQLEANESAILKNRRTQIQMVEKLVELYKVSGELDTLREEYEGRLAENPDDTLPAYLVALMRVESGNIEGAEPLINQLLADPSAINQEWYNKLAEAYRTAGDQEREVRLLERAVQKLSPWNTYQKSEMYGKLGAAQAQQGDKEKAADSFRKMGSMRLMAFGGSSFWEKQEIASRFMQHEMWDDAEAMYTEVLNDLSVDRYHREQAQQRLTEIKRRKSGVRTTTRLTEKAQEMNIVMQRALAEQHMHREQFSKAVELYKQIIATMPEDLESRAAVAGIYSRQGKHEAAITEWKALREIDPENTKYQDGLVDAYQSAGKTDEAIELAQKFIEAEESGVHYARLAKVYASIDRVDEAIAIYQKAIEINPGDRNVYQELAQLYIRKEDFGAAEKMYQYAIQYTGEEWERRNLERQLMELYRRQGKLEEMLEQAESEGLLTFGMQQERAQGYAGQGEWEQAAAAYKKAMDMTTQSWERNQVATELVKAYAQLGQTDMAIDVYKTLSRSGLGHVSMMSSSSGSLQIYFGGDQARESLINGYRSKGKLDDLLSYFEAQGEETVENPARLEITAEIHRTRGDYAKAAKGYQTLAKVHPGNVRSYYYAAAAFNKNGEPELAQVLLNEGETARSNDMQWRQDMWHLAALGGICLEGELYDPAIKLIDEAIMMTGRYGGFERPSLYNMLAQSYLGAERYEEAIDAYQQLENIAEDDGMRQTARAGMRRAYKAGNLHEKLATEKAQAVEDTSDDPDAHFALAQSYEWSDMRAKAIAVYERANELNPDSPVILAPLAKLYAETAPDKAKVLYKRLIELIDDPNDRIRKRHLLIEIYKKLGELDTAVAELHDLAGTATEKVERNSALHLLWGLFEDEERKNERVALFEELASQIKEDATVYQLLGDAYKAVENQEKAGIAYTQWIEFRQKEIDRSGENWDYYQLASELLEKGIMPEKALEFINRVTQVHLGSYHAAMVGEAYLLNEEYEKSAENFKRALSGEDSPFEASMVWSSLERASKTVKDEERFVELMEVLTETIPLDANERMHANLVFSTFYHERNQPEEAELYIRKSGVVPERAWWVLGPFDNTGGIGYNKTYIPEDAMEIDETMTYAGKDGQIGWKQGADETFDGYVNFAPIFGFGELDQMLMALQEPDPELDTVLAYAWTTVNSPDERQARIWISTLNDAKVWLNGQEVATIDRELQFTSEDHQTVPVTLQAGKNSILVKLVGRQWGWGFHLWLTDADGFPVEGLEYMNSPTTHESVEE